MMVSEMCYLFSLNVFEMGLSIERHVDGTVCLKQVLQQEEPGPGHGYQSTPVTAFASAS